MGWRVLSMLLSMLGSTLLGNLLIDKGINAKIPGRGVIIESKGAAAMSREWRTIRADHDFNDALSFN